MFQGNRYQETFLLNALKKDGIKVFLTGFDGDCTISYGMEENPISYKEMEDFGGIKLNSLTRMRKGLKDNSFKVIMSYIFETYALTYSSFQKTKRFSQF